MMAVYWLRIDAPLHTTVLGYRVNTNAGKALWSRLDWSEWWSDRCSHENAEYLHVAAWDGEDKVHYRVRCWFAGTMYRRWSVSRIGIGMKNGKWCWIVVTDKP